MGIAAGDSPEPPECYNVSGTHALRGRRVRLFRPPGEGTIWERDGDSEPVVSGFSLPLGGGGFAYLRGKFFRVVWEARRDEW